MVHPFIHKTITNPDDTKSAEKGIHFQRAAREFQPSTSVRQSGDKQHEKCFHNTVPYIMQLVNTIQAILFN